MSTATLPQTNKIVSFSNDVLEQGYVHDVPKPKFFERGGHSVMLMEKVAVFRSGTFRDSIGRQATYKPEDISAFVANFNNLKASGILPDVPVRKGHPQFGVSYMDTLIGHLVALRAEEKEASIGKQNFTVLFADYEILDKDAQEKISSGLWKNRSAEIGVYTDNDEVEHAPVFMGFAYVDVPAVERLNEFSKNGVGPDRLAFSYVTEEVLMSGAGPVAVPPLVQPVVNPPQAEPVQFSINGAATSDYVAVQNYIIALEKSNSALVAAEAKRLDAEREAFARSLAEGENPKIMASMVEQTVALAKSLSAEQFSAWKATMEGVAANPVLAQYGPGAGDTSIKPENEDAGNKVTPEDALFDNAKQIVLSMKQAGVPIDTIKAAPSYSKVISKDPGFVFPAN